MLLFRFSEIFNSLQPKDIFGPLVTLTGVLMTLLVVGYRERVKFNREMREKRYKETLDLYLSYLTVLNRNERRIRTAYKHKYDIEEDEDYAMLQAKSALIADVDSPFDLNEDMMKVVGLFTKWHHAFMQAVDKAITKFPNASLYEYSQIAADESTPEFDAYHKELLELIRKMLLMLHRLRRRENIVFRFVRWYKNIP